MKPYPEYKDTGLAWLPKIPKLWRIVRAKQLFFPIDQRSESGDEELLSVSGRFGVIKRANANVTMFMAASYKGYKLCWPDDLAINSLWAWSYGLGFSRYHGIISTAYSVFRLKDKEKCLPRFYDYFLRDKKFHWELRVRSKGLWKSRYQLSDDLFLSAPMIFPSSDEQAQIVRYLDAMTAKINKLIRAKKKQIALLQEQKQTIINQAVTQGLEPNAEMKDSGIDWLGKIPKHWEMPRLAFLTKKIGSGKTPKGGANIYSDEGIMFIRSQNVYFNELQTDNIRHITDEIDNTMPGTRVRDGDVLLNITGGSIGRCCVFALKKRANVNQHVCIIRCNDKAIVPEYLAHVLFSRIGQESIKLSQNAGNRESLTFVQVGAFIIPLPSLCEQKKILSAVHEKTNIFDKSIAYLSKAIALAQEAKQSFVSAVVTGKIDVRGLAVEDVSSEDIASDDEEASEDVEDETTEAESED